MTLDTASRVVLAGGGHAHLAVLADWARDPFPHTARWLVTSTRFTAYSGMLPGWLAGFYQSNDLLIDLAPLAERAGATLILADVTALDPVRQTLALSTGEELAFDLLSLAIGGETDIAVLAAAGDRLLPVRPVGAFMERWARLLEAARTDPLQQIAIVGGGAAGVELALGVAAALRRAVPGAQVSLVSSAERFLAGHAEKVRVLARQALRSRGIAVHCAQATGSEDGLLLSTGEALRADLVIAATGSRAPPWLAQSGLACTSRGFVSVGADLRSLSHGAIFAAGDIIERADRTLERSGVHAVKAGPVLAANLRAVLSGGAMQRYEPRRRTLYLLALGDRRAIVSWGGVVAAGRWVWRIKDWIDRSFLARYISRSGASR